ncbi:MAG: hypothetical protein NC301_07005 [Bacteroides sp.]|nr:hypothetical protein [Bacteroides sp.]MCM1379947.1 hypothetical protein [Bacteroides sp.]MCM1446198.1 hypothetical protein [Prevotella sp.]
MKKLLLILAGLTLAAGLSAVELRYYPYELKLRHAYNLASMSRTTTPGVQVEFGLAVSRQSCSQSGN